MRIRYCFMAFIVFSCTGCIGTVSLDQLEDAARRGEANAIWRRLERDWRRIERDRQADQCSDQKADETCEIGYSAGSADATSASP